MSEENNEHNESENTSQSWQVVLINKLFDVRNAWVLALLVGTNAGQALLTKGTEVMTGEPDTKQRICDAWTEDQLKELSYCPDTIRSLVEAHSSQITTLIESCKE